MQDFSTGISTTLIAVTVSNPLGLSFELVEVWDDDPEKREIICTGIFTVDGLVPAGPDGFSTPHTLAIPTPTKSLGFTIYARTVKVENRAAVDLRGGIDNTRDSVTIRRNTIVPGVTPGVHLTIGANGAGTVDMRAMRADSHSADFGVDPVSGLFSQLQVDMSKAAHLSSQFQWDPAAGVQKIINLDAGLIKTGAFQVGGPGKISQAKFFDKLGNLIGFIGDDTGAGGSGFDGAWFKGPFGLAGTDPLHPLIFANAAGSLAINGSVIVGDITGKSANITGTLLLSQLGTGTLPVGVVYAGTVLCSQLGSGTLPVGVVYAGTVNCSQLGSGTLPVGVVYAGTVAVDKITGWSGATIDLGANDLTFSGSAGCHFQNTGTGQHAYAEAGGFTVGTRGAGFTLGASGLFRGATKIVGAQQSAIANGSDATVNAILAALRAHGLIAT